MECLEPGIIRDEELFAYLAGERVRPIVEHHLAICQRCAEQLAEYRRIEFALTSKLYRWDCPPNQILGEYQLGLVRKELAAAVKNHLSMCVLCADEVATLSEFLANDPMLAEPVSIPYINVSVRPSSSKNHSRAAQGAKSVVEHLREQSTAGVRRVIATLLPPPRLVYRGGDMSQVAVWPRRYTAEDVNISIQIERATSRRDSLQLIGLVTRPGEALEALQGTQVVLSSHTNAVDTQSVDELGNFVFPSVVPATYTLELQLAESTIVIDFLPVALQD